MLHQGSQLTPNMFCERGMAAPSVTHSFASQPPAVLPPSAAAAGSEQPVQHACWKPVAQLLASAVGGQPSMQQLQTGAQ